MGKSARWGYSKPPPISSSPQNLACMFHSLFEKSVQKIVEASAKKKRLSLKWFSPFKNQTVKRFYMLIGRYVKGVWIT